MFEAPTEGAWGLTVTDDFIDKATAAGFTSVRLPVRWSNHAGAAGAVHDRRGVHGARRIGRRQAAGEGTWWSSSTCTTTGSSTAIRSTPASRRSPAAVVDVRFVMLWEQIATHFQGRGPRLVFELYNEPHGRMNGEPWNVLAARALRVVRRTNPDRIVVIGPTSWNSASDLRLLKMPNDANLIATVHNYNPVPVHASGRGVGHARACRLA